MPTLRDLINIPRVLYAPQKVFKEIAENPRYLGPALVLILFVALQTGAYYVQYSKQHYELTAPIGTQIGAWTADNTLWTTDPESS